MTDIPAMMLWTDAYLGDTGHLTATEHGAYLLILMAMWRAGGSLPDDEIRLARTARLSLDKWRRIAPTIREFFTMEDGTVTQKRLKLEFEIASGKTEKRRAAGKSGGDAKALKYNNRRSSIARDLPLANGKQTPSHQNQSQKEEKELSNESSKKPASRSRRTQIAADEQPNETQRRHAAESVGMTPAVFRSEWQRFRDHHRAKGSVMADWDAAWRTWCANWTRFNGKPEPQPAADGGTERRIALPGGASWRESAIKAAIEKFEQNPATWPVSVLGNYPGKPGCYVPPDLLPEKYRAAQRELLTERQSERVQ